MLRNSLRVAAAVVSCVCALGCSSPTRPSALPSAAAPAAWLAQAPGTDTCSAYSGATRGLCQSLFGAGCTVNGPTPEHCDSLIGTFRTVTGSYPDFIYRGYISRDPAVCVNIRWACTEGFDPFSDETGCGCQRSE